MCIVFPVCGARLAAAGEQTRRMEAERRHLRVEQLVLMCKAAMAAADARRKARAWHNWRRTQVWFCCFVGALWGLSKAHTCPQRMRQWRPDGEGPPAALRSKHSSVKVDLRQSAVGRCFDNEYASPLSIP